jgi:hypothetical protein
VVTLRGCLSSAALASAHQRNASTTSVPAASDYVLSAAHARVYSSAMRVGVPAARDCSTLTSAYGGSSA